MNCRYETYLLRAATRQCCAMGLGAIEPSERQVLRRRLDPSYGLKEAERLAAHTGAEAVLPSPPRNIDHVHRAVALASDEQFVLAECHVHGLMADLDCGLLLERRVDQAHRVAVKTGDADHAVVR